MTGERGNYCSLAVSNGYGNQGARPVGREPDTAKPERPSTGEAAGLHIQLLSEFKVCVGDRVVDESEWYLRKTKNLVKLLALAPNHRLHRGELMDLLWPDFEPGAAANNLHKALHMARRTIEPDLPAKTASAYLHMAGEFVVLDPPGSLWVDVESFRALAQVARGSHDPDSYEAAVRLYTGDLLPEDRYEDWAIRDREELEAIYLGLLLEYSELQQQRGKPDAAIETLRWLVARDPAHEEAQTSLIRLLARSGFRQLALRQYLQLRDALRQELDVDPEPSAQRLYQEILAGEVTGTAPSTPPVGSTSQQLERTTSPAMLVGRDLEMARLDERLDQVFLSRGSIVLLSGEAGSGKSRLAAEMRSRAEERGAIALWGAAYQHRRELPYGPFRVACESFAMRVSPDTLQAVVGDSASALAKLAPLVALTLDLDQQPHSASSGMDESEILAGVSSFLIQLSKHVPVVIVLEDLQVAEQASLRLLEHLAAVIQNLPVLILCTFRPDEVIPGSILDRLTETVELQERGASLSLAPLGYAEACILATSLLGGPADQAVLDAICRLANGNPHYIEEAVHALRGRSRICQVNGVWNVRDRIVITLDQDQLRQRRRASGDYRLAQRLRAV